MPATLTLPGEGVLRDRNGFQEGSGSGSPLPKGENRRVEHRRNCCDTEVPIKTNTHTVLMFLKILILSKCQPTEVLTELTCNKILVELTQTLDA